MLDLIATVGPASLGCVAELVQAGATAFRLNASHLSTAELEQHATRIRAAVPHHPLVIDLQGAKMRLGVFAERAVAVGDTLRLVVGSAADDGVPLPHAEIFQQVEVGHTLSMDDGRLSFVVERAGAEVIEVRALVAGVLRPRKGVNVVEHPVRLADLVPADQAAVAALSGWQDVSFAVSFVTDGHELEWVRHRAPKAPLVAKVERTRALDAIDQIEHVAESIWICRGDLGAQVGLAKLARFVRSFEVHGRTCDILMAGQVFEHLTEHADPTRSEVCHLYDLLQRGYQGLVLSDETAIGVDPVRAVRRVAELLEMLG